MKTVVITGSARGLGFELAKEFRKNNYNVVLSDVMGVNLKNAKITLEKEIIGKGNIESVLCDVTKESDLENLMAVTTKNLITLMFGLITPELINRWYQFGKLIQK